MTDELAAGRPRGRDEAVQLWRPPDGPWTAQAIARLGASTPLTRRRTSHESSRPHES